ncbi:hypothetical protein CRE_15825 [Caenorhabditis remanei]|nr:hypothetical protein CRE_15825 [Caenorhabditis remanei]
MERMRTGDRPLTMLPSLTAMFDGNDEELVLDDDGNEILLPPPNLTHGGELDKQSFLGFHYLEARPGDGPPPPDGSNDDIVGEPTRRPSSRSAPTSAPRAARDSPAPPPEVAPEGADVAPAVAPAAPEVARRRRPKRNFFSCIFRSRTDSN